MQRVTVTFFLVIYMVVIIVKADSLFKLRVVDGVADTNNEYPFVVSLQRKDPLMQQGYAIYRSCSGSLIAPEWVLTAAHCMNPEVKLVRHGNMTIPRNATDGIKEIVNMYPHPSYKVSKSFIIHDIGLILTQRIHATVGKLSAIDSNTMTGVKVKYAGFGWIGNYTLKQVQPLQVGEGMAIKCPANVKFYGPRMCVVPRCNRKTERWAGGDSGGPVMFGGKIIAIISAREDIGIYTPVSPYLDWIRNTIIGNTNSN